MDEHGLEQTIEVPAPHGPASHAEPNVLEISGPMMVLTWVTFILMCIVLYKLAWKPILAALDQREEDIRRSVGEAARIREELKQIGEVQRRIVAEADEKAKKIVADARKAAREAALTIEHRAREDSKILIENATREINVAQEKAQATLKRQSAELAVGLAAKILREKVTAEQDHKLIERLLREV